MLDVIVLAVIAFLVIGGYMRGFLQAVVGLVGSLVSVALSAAGASILAPEIYANFVQQRVVDAIGGMLPEFDARTKAVEIADTLQKQLPDYAKNALEMTGIDYNQLVQEITKTNLSIPEMVEGMIRPVLIRLVTVIAAFIIFMILVSIISILTRSVSVVAQKTGLAGADRVLGAVLGLAEAAVLIMIMTMIIYFLLVLMPQENAQELQQAIDSSLLYKQIYMFNLPDIIMNAISGLSKG